MVKIPHQLKHYIKHLPTVALFLGLIFDFFTLKRPDATYGNVVIVGYLLLTAMIILVLQVGTEKTRKDGGNKRIFLLSVLQFSFGNLTSALTIIYSLSGTFAGNTIFMGILILLLFGNELLRDHYARTYLRILIWFILLATYTTILIPILLSSIGAFTFLISVGTALFIASIFIFILSRVSAKSFNQHLGKTTISIILVSIIFSILYFSNLIPPVPLALKQIGIYHSVSRFKNTYSATYEPAKWYKFWRDTNAVFVQNRNTPVYCFSSIFAPKNLETQIKHRWEKYNAKNNKWYTIALIPFKISGGRLSGFRGYTQTSQVTSGKWRCSVETNRGALIGRTTFLVTSGTPDLKEISL